MIVLHADYHGPLEVGTDEYRDAWLPRLGPSSYLMMLDLARHAGVVQPAALAERLGISNDRLCRSVERLASFGHILRLGDNAAGEPIIEVRLRVWTPRRSSNNGARPASATTKEMHE